MINKTFFFVFFFIISCGDSDLILSLGNNFFYNGEGRGANYIFYSKKKNAFDKVYILPSVLGYNYNKKYILVIQKPSRLAIKHHILYNDTRLSEKKMDVKEYNKLRKEILIETDSIIKTDLKYKKIFANEINYWIINKETAKLFGPYSKEEYLKKKQELGVSKKLKLPNIKK